MNKQTITMFQKTVKFEQDSIWIKPICDFFDIGYKYHLKMIRNDHILASMAGKKANESLFGDKYERVLLPKIGFLRWIQLINPKTVREDLQDKFKKYQTLVVEYLFGSVKKIRQASVHYKRLKKLERLKRKINSEIKSEKRHLEHHWDRRYLQGEFAFEALEEPNND